MDMDTEELIKIQQKAWKDYREAKKAASEEMLTMIDAIEGHEDRITRAYHTAMGVDPKARHFIGVLNWSKVTERMTVAADAIAHATGSM